MKIKKKADNTRNQKGEIAEKIVALLHEQPGIAVERNIWLPTKDGKDKREIDVLISGSIAGYPVRLAIECKNYHKPIQKKDIDAFVGKLNDLSFPTQQCIFVCTSKYTEGAIKRASSAGIRTLLLKGLTQDRLKEAIYDALQSVVYLFPLIASLSLFNEAPTISTEELVTFVNESGDSFNLIDIIWHNWCEGKYPRSIGAHNIQVEIPEGFTNVQNGKRLKQPTVAVTLQVHALVVEIPGVANQFELHNSSTETLEKMKLSLLFETCNGLLPLHIFTAEDELKKFIDSKPQKFKITFKQIIPKVLTPKYVFWPPSQIYIDNINRLICEKGSDVNLEELDTSHFQGDDLLSAAYADIWEGHPASQRKK